MHDAGCISHWFRACRIRDRAALCHQNLKVHGLASTGPFIPWSTTFPSQRPLSGVEGDAYKSSKQMVSIGIIDGSGIWATARRQSAAGVDIFLQIARINDRIKIRGRCCRFTKTTVLKGSVLTTIAHLESQ